MDNFIKVNEVDEENTNILHRRFVQRYREEKGRLLTDHESNLCWWNICGVVMRDGYSRRQRKLSHLNIITEPSITAVLYASGKSYQR